MSNQQIEAVILDMDGVLWRGDEPLPGMQALFGLLRERNLSFALATNNSGRHPETYVQRLAAMGVRDIQQEQIITSGTATADYLTQRHPQGTRLHVIGHAGLRRVLDEAGFVLADDDVAVVVVGIDFEFTYEKAKRAALLIRNEGAEFIGTNPDTTFPAPEGLVPGAGSLIAMIEAAVDVEPTVIGKPEPAMFRVAVRRMNADPQTTLMIGDRLNTDIYGARNAGLQSALVLTGVTTERDLRQSPFQPDAVFDNLTDLLDNWDATYG